MTRLDRIDVDENNIIHVRLVKVGGGPKHDGGYHRTTIVPGASAAKVLAAINADLALRGVNAIADWAPVTAAVAKYHTVANIAAYNAALAAPVVPV